MPVGGAQAGTDGGPGLVREESIDLTGSAPEDSPGAAGKLGTRHTLRVSGKLTEGVLDIPGTAVINDSIKMKDGKPISLKQAPKKEAEPDETVVADKTAEPGESAQTQEVGDEKTDKSWWKIW